MTDKKFRFTPVLLALMLVASTVLVSSGGARPTSATQLNDIQSDLGFDAPHGEWETTDELTTLYLHSDYGGYGDLVLNGGDFATANAGMNFDTPRQAAFDASYVAFTGPTFLLTDSVTFPMTEQALDDVNIYGFATQMHAMCDLDGDPIALSAGPDVSIWHETFDAVSGTWIRENSGPITTIVTEGSWTVPPVQPGTLAGIGQAVFGDPDASFVGLHAGAFRGTSQVGSPVQQDGYMLPAGDRLAADISISLIAVECAILYDSWYYNSHVEVWSDSARHNVWFEDIDGVPVDGFPSADAAGVADRTMKVQHLQASAWSGVTRPSTTGNEYGGAPPATMMNVDSWCSTSSTDSDYCADHYRVRQRDFLEIRDDVTGELLFDSQVYEEEFDNPDFNPRNFDWLMTDDEERVIDAGPTGDSVRLRTYTLVYPPEAEDIVYQAEIQSISNGFYYEGSRYQSEDPDFTGRWQVNTDFAIGVKGISLTLAPGETATHLINRGEPTEFRFLLKNIGFDDDTITVTASEPGSSWTSEISPGLAALEGGASAFLTLRVDSPETAAIGEEKEITVIASSSHEEVPAKIIKVKAKITDVVKHAVDLVGVTDVLNIRPLQTKTFGVTMINRGNALDHFVVGYDVPNNAENWGIAVTPLSKELVAHGTTELTITVSAPGTIPDGFSFPLTLTAKRVGDATVNSEFITTIQVFVVEGFLLDMLDNGITRGQRDDSPPACIDSLDGILCLTGADIPDTDFDKTAIHRVELTNTGDTAREYAAEVYWNNHHPEVAGQIEDVNICNAGTRFDVIVAGPIGVPLLTGSADGVPDGWRFNYAGDVGMPVPPADSPQRGELARNSNDANLAHSGFIQLHDAANPIVVEPGETKYLYFEMGFPAGDVCPETDDDLLLGSQTISDTYSPTAALTLNVNSLSEPGVVKSVTMVNRVGPYGTFLGQNHYSGDVLDVKIEPEVGQELLVNAPPKPTAASAQGPAVFDLRGINAGNVLDNLTFEVLGGEPHWTYSISARAGEHVPASNVCGAPTAGGTRITCNGMGIYDEAALTVTATPDDDFIRIGDVTDFQVLVTSGDLPEVRDIIDLRARLAGTFDFIVELDNNDLRAHRGDTVSIPFTIYNRGTEGDTYTLGLTNTDGGILAYDPQFGGPTQIFVPAGFRHTSFLSVQVPADATIGAKQKFDLLVTSAGGATTVEPDLFVEPIRTPNLNAVALYGAVVVDEFTVLERGVPETFQVRASGPVSLAGQQVKITIDQQTLPRGWSIDPEEVAGLTLTRPTPAATTVQATGTFQITAPDDALGTSRVPIRFAAETSGVNPVKRFGEVIANVQDVYGLRLNSTEGLTQTVAAGGEVVYNIQLENLGLSADTATVTVGGAPAGWIEFLSPATVNLGPLQTKDITFKLQAPADAAPGAVATTLVYAASQSELTAFDTLELLTTVGIFGLDVDGFDVDVYGAPQELLTHVVDVTNIGTLPDNVRISAELLTTVFDGDVGITLEPALTEIEPGEIEQVQLGLTLSDDIPAGSEIVIAVHAASLLDAAPVPENATDTVVFKVLDYDARDVDGDGLVEYAVDRDMDNGNGFEEFRENTQTGGIRSTSLDMRVFLDREARLAHTFTENVGGVDQEVVVLDIDGDEDGRFDMMIDTAGDGLPDTYYDPDDEIVTEIDTKRDVDADGTLDYFIDLDADGLLDTVYNLREGTFTDLLQIDADGDGRIDYVVDRNGNGERDDFETVLLSRFGGLVTIVKVDMTGNDQIDDVFDEDGDGRPDYFVPFGSKDGIRIVLKDVTGDGILDWTYDANGDGDVDSYYNPQDGTVGQIDSEEDFLDLLFEYWYVAALFLLVTMLFVVLLAVTRR